MRFTCSETIKKNSCTHHWGDARQSFHFKKMTKHFFPHFRVTPLIFWVHPRKDIKTWNFGIGVLQQFGTSWHVAKIVFKNHCTLLHIRYIFMSPIPTSWWIGCACSVQCAHCTVHTAHAPKFLLLKNQRDSKINILMFANTLLLLQRTINKKKILNSKLILFLFV